MILCAYNGFNFDFVILAYHLNHYDLFMEPDFILNDTYADQLVHDKESITCDQAFHRI